MGIPKFYRWLKARYPLIRFQITDPSKQFPQIDNFYIDFNALIYQCIRQEGTFLRNKVLPLTFKEIHERVMEYLQQLIQIVSPSKLLFIGLDGVAPRAKINQSRDRRFRAGQQSGEFRQLTEKAGILGKENFKNNSISPGTQFLVGLCTELKKYIMEKMENQWKHLKVIYSDCSVPGQGQHKIMSFLRQSAQIGIFSNDATHCIYSPDADVILLTLTLQINNICLIKEDTTIFAPSILSAVPRFRQPPKFEMVMINILSQYLEKEFSESMKDIPGCKIQDIINDFILLMTFVGNDFLPSEFCFTLKDNHMDELYKSYKEYLKQSKKFINNKGEIDWGNVGKLLEIATVFEATMIQQKIKNYKANKQNPNYVPSKNDDNAQSQLQFFEVADHRITKGKQNYYKTRFQLDKATIVDNPKLITIIQKYLEGLHFYCQYYFKGLPSWTWYYPYHYTPLLTDILWYLQANKANIKLFQGQPYDPFFALMFMLPESSFPLLPKPIQNILKRQDCPLRTPHDYYPLKFQLDKYQTLKYNKRALIPFLQEQDVKKVYSTIKRQDYSRQQLDRNIKTNTIIFYYTNDPIAPKLTGVQMPNSKQTKLLLQTLFPNPKPISQHLRFPTLQIYGKWQLDQKGRMVTPLQYKQQNPTDVVFFNNFQGFIDNEDDCSADLKAKIQIEYSKLGIVGKCERYFTIKQCRHARTINGFRLVRSRRQVIVPDFALHRTPKYSYLKKTQQIQHKQQYAIGQRVAILNSTNFGCIAVVQKLRDKDLDVRIIEYGYKSTQKIQDFDQQFYTIDYVVQKMDVSFDVLLAILDEVILLPQFPKKSLKDFLPQGLNFGLGVISQKKMLLVPQYARCQVQNQNSYKPSALFKKVELSQSCLQILQKYIQTFGWLIDYLENFKQSWKKNIYARDIFDTEEDSNSKLLSEYSKLFTLNHDGLFHSIYSKITLQNVNFLPCEKPANTLLTLKYYEVISKRQARIAPPALRSEPQYHDVGQRVIYLRSLQTGIVTGIDDNMMYVKLPKRSMPKKVGFIEIFNQKWVKNLQKEDPTSWDLEVSYFQPTYWKKAIDKI